jgi:hypothetical protein
MPQTETSHVPCVPPPPWFRATDVGERVHERRSPGRAARAETHHRPHRRPRRVADSHRWYRKVITDPATGERTCTAARSTRGFRSGGRRGVEVLLAHAHAREKAVWKSVGCMTIASGSTKGARRTEVTALKTASAVGAARARADAVREQVPVELLGDVGDRVGFDRPSSRARTSGLRPPCSGSPSG